MTKIAVEFQNGLSPMAFTTSATHCGPVALPHALWSEFRHVGVTQVTDAKRPRPTSAITRAEEPTTFWFQSGPNRICLIEPYASHCDDFEALYIRQLKPAAASSSPSVG